MILALALVCLVPLCSAETWGAPVNFDNMCRRETVCFLDCPFGRASDERGCEICACRMPDFSDFGMDMAGSHAESHVPEFVPQLVPFSNGLPFLAPIPEAVPMLQPVPHQLEPIPQLIPASPELIPAGDAPQLVPALEPAPQLQPAPLLVPARRSIPSRFLKTGNKA
ncbi:PREDICTED: uncharacterized protein LOC109468639 [Branchiostoma belcheri]|uniref:Uncharacterized protein LOC109468639 n=1 Tax=Branchiostoma belcheri TaxID=7741 RepID=A0A6P4YLE3_BRABE|nr:PREDICTED: uncharacterized protein LOC109468639 [Branchiostoma belcheri]